MVEAQKTGIHAVEHRVQMRLATGTIGFPSRALSAGRNGTGYERHERSIGMLQRIAAGSSGCGAAPHPAT